MSSSRAGNLMLTVLLPTAHRVNVKITPNTSILQVLEEACQKSALNPQEWDLKHYNRILELSNSIRFSALPNNATVEMVPATKARKESTVKLGLQLESGKRLMDEFRPSQTLWEILEHWNEKGEKVVVADLESEGDILPVCVYMRNEVVGRMNLQSITLRSLGLTQGSAMIRLLHRSENQLKHQANVSAPLVSKSNMKVNEDEGRNKMDTPVASDSRKQLGITGEQQTIKEISNSQSSHNSNTTTEPEPMQEVVDSTHISSVSNADHFSSDNRQIIDGVNEDESADIPMDLASDTEAILSSVSSIVNAQRYSKIGDYYLIGEKDAVIYHSDDVIVQNNDNIPDDFFNVTLADVDLMYKDLKSKRVALEDSPLLTAAQRALERDQSILRNMREHPTTTVRIRFSNRYVLQGTFRTLETIGAVAEFVRKFLNDSGLDFYLFTTPPKKILNNEVRLIEEGLVGLAVMYFGGQVSDESILKSGLYEKLSDPNIVFEKLRVAHKASIVLSTIDTSLPSTNMESHVLPSTSTSHVGVPDSQSSPRPAPMKQNNVASGNAPKWFKR